VKTAQIAALRKLERRALGIWRRKSCDERADRSLISAGQPALDCYITHVILVIESIMRPKAALPSRRMESADCRRKAHPELSLLRKTASRKALLRMLGLRGLQRGGGGGGGKRGKEESRRAVGELYNWKRLPSPNGATALIIIRKKTSCFAVRNAEEVGGLRGVSVSRPRMECSGHC
jgi:hypothetical protein